VGHGGEQEETIGFLSEPRSYGPGVQTVERHETHGAIVFLAGDRAYKLKRTVKYPYMDYSTVERRRQMCALELAVNRRMAPTLYLDVCPIVRDRAGLRFGRATEGAGAVDWVVVMRRFDQAALLESLRRSGGLTTDLMRHVAEAIARFHADAEVRTDFGGEAALRAVIATSSAILQSRSGHPFRSESVKRYEDAAPSTLGRVAALLEERRQTGHVRHCHGDLHLNNIFVQDAQPILFDAIEFEDRFAYIDVLYDLAFLLMDLDRHGLRGHANAVLNRYLELSGEHAGLAAMPLFLSCRAAIRAHTAVSAAEAIDDSDRRTQLLDEACDLLDRACDYLAKPMPRLIAIGGLSGTGKTTLASDLAPLLGACPGAVVVRSDVIRKQLMGVAETVRLPMSAYTAAINEQVYKRIADIASTALASGFSAIADAVFGRDDERQGIAEVARRSGASFDGLWLEGPVSILERRIAARVGDASDATPDVLRAQLGFVTAPQAWKHIDVGAPKGDTLAAAKRYLGG
jgi:hypothetical protein